MKRFVNLCLALSLVAPVVIGCDKTATTTKETTVKTPQGTSTVTDTEKVKESGDNPPPVNR